jgi:UTP--glucose-1-phosphate uridylyltransferase
MFPLVDKPLAQYAIEEAVAAGIEEVIFITGQTKRAIEDHFDTNFELEYLLKEKGKEEQLAQVREISGMCKFAYVRQPEMKGLGDAILQAKNLVNDEPFAIMTPDDIFSGTDSALKQLVEAFEKTEAPIIGVTEVPKERIDQYGVVSGEVDDTGMLKMTGTVEKPSPEEAPTNLAQCGRYIMTPDLFEILESVEPGKGGEVQMTDAYDQLLAKRPVYAATIDGEYHDAGSKLGYMQAFVEYGLNRDDLGEDFRKFLKNRLK